MNEKKKKAKIVWKKRRREKKKEKTETGLNRKECILLKMQSK